MHVYTHRSLATTGDLCSGVLAFVRDQRPDYLAIFPSWLPCFTDLEFPPVLRISVPGNITLGGETIVLHATPWTRYPLRPEMVCFKPFQARASELARGHAAHPNICKPSRK